MRALADELVRLPVDLIVVQGEAVLEIKATSLPVPVVYAYSGDPVAAGLAESLAQAERQHDRADLSRRSS